MRTVIFKVIACTCVFAIVVQAQITSFRKATGHEGGSQTFTPSRNHELEIKSGERDFLLPGEGFATKTTPANASVQKSSNGILSNSFPAESVVEYKSFAFGTTFTLHAFSGKYVSYLMAETMIGDNGLSREEIRELVDLTDLLYAHMAEIVGGEPSGEGLLTIALLNPGRDFGGKGWVGKKGVEMYEGYATRYRKDFLAGCVPNPVVHEMAHNFDIYNEYISHDGNNAHAWTAFLIPYVQYYTQAGASWAGQVVNPTTLLAETIDIDMDPWDAAGPSVTWNECVKTGSGCWDKEIYANETWGGIVLRYARLHGASVIKQAFRFVGDYKAAHATPPATAEEKNDVLALAFAAGAHSDISCELKVWNWPISAEMAQRIKSDFPNQNPFCADVDNDGLSPAHGDHDDFNAAIRPGTTETVNGLDEDCDSVVDDLVVNEVDDLHADAYTAMSVTIPGHVIGHTATANDSDSYQFEIDTPRSINIWAKGMTKSFTGWFELRYASDPNTTSPTYLPSGFPGGSVIPLNRAGTWIITVMPWSGADEGYEIFLSDVDRMPVPQLRLTATAKTGSVFVFVTSDISSFKESAPTRVRLWAEGLGFIGEQRFEPSTIFKLRFPPDANIRLRAQLLYDDSPLSNMTKPVTFGWQTKTLSTTVTPSPQNSPILVIDRFNTAARLKTNSLSPKLGLVGIRRLSSETYLKAKLKQ